MARPCVRACTFVRGAPPPTAHQSATDPTLRTTRAATARSRRSAGGLVGRTHRTRTAFDRRAAPCDPGQRRHGAGPSDARANCVGFRRQSVLRARDRPHALRSRTWRRREMHPCRSATDYSSSSPLRLTAISKRSREVLLAVAVLSRPSHVNARRRLRLPGGRRGARGGRRCRRDHSRWRGNRIHAPTARLGCLCAGITGAAATRPSTPRRRGIGPRGESEAPRLRHNRGGRGHRHGGRTRSRSRCKPRCTGCSGRSLRRCRPSDSIRRVEQRGQTADAEIGCIARGGRPGGCTCSRRVRARTFY